MAIISVIDNHGNPITVDKGRINVRVSKGTDDQSVDDRFTDDVGHTSWPGGFVGGDVWSSANLYVNTRNVNKSYSNTTVTSADLTKDLTITLQEVSNPNPPNPNPCPVDYDKQQFTNWFNAHKVGVLVTTQNMVAMKDALIKCGMEWQNMCRSEDQWRPRIHQPPFLNGPCTGSTHDVDCGDFGQPWVLTFRY